MMRIRKFVLESSVGSQTWPQVSAEVPSVYVEFVVLRVVVDLAVVQVVPPFHDNCTQNFGELVVLFTFPVSFTSMPLIAVAPGVLKL